MINNIARCSALIVACFASAASLAEDFKLNRYVSSTVYNTNSYWLESDSGVALIDAQMLRSDAELMATMIESTGKTVKGVIVTHPHFDHFGGLNLLRQKFGEFPIYASKGTADGFKASHEGAMAWAPGVHGPDYDKTMIEPDQIVESGETIEIAGISFKIDDLGAGEAENKHAHLKENYSSVKTFFAGHGDPSPPAVVLDFEVEYVEYVQTLVKGALQEGDIMKDDNSGVKEPVLESLVNQVIARYPYLNEYGIGTEKVIGWGIAAVIGELNTKAN